MANDFIKLVKLSDHAGRKWIIRSPYILWLLSIVWSYIDLALHRGEYSYIPSIEAVQPLFIMAVFIAQLYAVIIMGSMKSVRSSPRIKGVFGMFTPVMFTAESFFQLAATAVRYGIMADNGSEYLTGALGGMLALNGVVIAVMGIFMAVLPKRPIEIMLLLTAAVFIAFKIMNFNELLDGLYSVSTVGSGFLAAAAAIAVSAVIQYIYCCADYKKPISKLNSSEI